MASRASYGGMPTHSAALPPVLASLLGARTDDFRPRGGTSTVLCGGSGSAGLHASGSLTRASPPPGLSHPYQKIPTERLRRAGTRAPRACRRPSWRNCPYGKGSSRHREVTMSANNEPAKHRRGTDVRQRQAQVAVRLNPSELATLRAVADRNGQTLAAALREGFLRHATASS
jgi:hypothetical protein